MLSNSRLLLLDAMRALAVLMMIQGHSLDALLKPDYIDSSKNGWELWKYMRGITAPIFLFGSGFVYLYSASLKMKDGRPPISLFFKRLRWLLLLFAWGTIMHFPYENLSDLIQNWEASLPFLLKGDVLRLMAITLLMALVILATCHSFKSIFIVSTICTLLIVAISPYMRYLFPADQTHHPIWNIVYLSANNEFSIFAFSAYLLAGMAFCSGLLMIKEKRVLIDKWYTYLIAGAIALLLNYIIAQFPLVNPPDLEYWNHSPNLFFLRLSTVLFLWSFVAFVLQWAQGLPKFISIMGQHTLSIYVVHVIIIYGFAWNKGLYQLWGKSLSLIQVLPIIGALVMLMLAMAYLIHFIEKNYNRGYYLIQFGIFALLTFSFLVY